MEEEEEREENQGWEDGLSGELSPNHDQEARQPAEPTVMREEATDEESDDSGPPGLMDMDGNIVSSSSEDEEEVARRILEMQNRDTPGLTDTSDGERAEERFGR